MFLAFDVMAAETCRVENKSTQFYWNEITASLKAGSSVVAECVDKEVVDLILDPYRMQSLALKLCNETTQCQDFLATEAARVSKKDIAEFSGKPLVFVWGEITRYAGFNRVRPPTIQDFPISLDPEELFRKIKAEKLSKTTLDKSENLKMACSVLSIFIGPGKLKAVKAAGTFAAATKIQHSHEVEKLITKNRLPTQVKEKFLKWVEEVESKGLEEVKKIPGYHDEPLKQFQGQRHSVRLSDGFRACYEKVLENGVTILKVITISQDHKSYCK